MENETNKPVENTDGEEGVDMTKPALIMSLFVALGVLAIVTVLAVAINFVV